jgi:hypothetical protein
MFGILVNLVGQNIVHPYYRIMGDNAVDGRKFEKPPHGHEDGCINKVCNEHHAGEYRQY